MDANNMKRKIIPVLIGCTLSFSALAAQPTAERYVVSFPEGTHVNYAGAFASAFPIVLGIGVGAACPVLISAIGANKNGKRTALIYLMNDLFGLILWSIIFYTANAYGYDHDPGNDRSTEYSVPCRYSCCSVSIYSEA